MKRDTSLLRPTKMDKHTIFFKCMYAHFQKGFHIGHFEVALETESRWFQSALWDCFGGRIFNMVANSSPKAVPQCTLTIISTRSPSQPQSGKQRYIQKKEKRNQKKETILGTGFLTYNPTLANCIYFGKSQYS